jgi:hypothetical protein
MNLERKKERASDGHFLSSGADRMGGNQHRSHLTPTHFRTLPMNIIPKGNLEFSGESEIYDDGIFRIQMPSELIFQTTSEKGSMIFSIGDLPLEIEWATCTFDSDDLEQFGVSTESIDQTMRQFIPGFPEDAPLKLIPMANGFMMTSHYSIDDGECRSYYLLGQLTEEQAFIGSSMSLKGAEAWDDDPRFAGLDHLLKQSMRFAYCSMGEPRINSSSAWLSVDKIRIRFPEEMGGMSYRFATDYESLGPGEGFSLRYRDDDGRKADLYIYDLQEELIEPGTDSDQVIAQMEDSVSELETIHATSGLKVLSNSITSYGRDALPFRDTRYLIGTALPEEECFMSAILLTARFGAYLKVRFSSLPGECEEEHPVLSAFMKDLAVVLN